MKERGELARKLEQTTINLHEIQALYNNAKRYIFKTMDISSSEAGSNGGDSEDVSMGEISRLECERSRELEIVRYHLTLKTKECEEKDLKLESLQHFEAEATKLKLVVQDQQKELEELRRHAWKELSAQPTTRLGKAHRTIISELQQILHQLELCERLLSI